MGCYLHGPRFSGAELGQTSGYSLTGLYVRGVAGSFARTGNE